MTKIICVSKLFQNCSKTQLTLHYHNHIHKPVSDVLLRLQQSMLEIHIIIVCPFHQKVQAHSSIFLDLKISFSFTLFLGAI